MLSKISGRKDSSTSRVRSKDIMPQTGDKCKDLFDLSKHIINKRDKTDKTRDDYDFERNKDECTFTPNVVRVGDMSQTIRNGFLNNKKYSLQQSKSAANLRAT